MGIINYFFFCRKCFNQRSHLLIGQNIALTCNDIIKGKEVNIYSSENIFHKNAEKKENCVVKHCQCHNVSIDQISIQYLSVYSFCGAKWYPQCQQYLWYPIRQYWQHQAKQILQTPLGNTDSSGTIGHHKVPVVSIMPKGVPVSVVSMVSNQLKVTYDLSIPQCIINYFDFIER